MTNPNDMPAGVEIDRLVAEKVLGHRWSDARWAGFYEDAGYGHYSSNIAHAWEVVEKLRDRGIRLAIVQTGAGWLVGQDDGGGYVGEHTVDIRLFSSAEADTAPLAICRAALAALS